MGDFGFSMLLIYNIIFWVLIAPHLIMPNDITRGLEKYL